MNLRSTRAKAAVAATGLVIAATSSVVAPQVATASNGVDSTYLVLYRDGASSAGAANTVRNAGGTLVANYSQIGVVVARSSNTSFASAVRQDGNVSGAARTNGFATQLRGVADSGAATAVPLRFFFAAADAGFLAIPRPRGSLCAPESPPTARP